MNEKFFTIASAEELMARARAETGIDLEDTAALEPLTVYVDSVNRDGRLDEPGAGFMEQWILRSLHNRLRMLRDFAAHPEIHDEVIKAPVFVCGSTRTGSTKCQKLLAATGDFNYLTFWKSLNPSLVTGDRQESPDARIKDADAYVEWFDRESPNAKLIHIIRTHEPEEESFVLAHSLTTPVITGMAEVPSYIQWLMTRDISPQFEFLRDVLKYLQWQGYADPEKRWLLKSPFYAGLEPILLKVFPDAQLLMTHRNPLETMPSTCSLFTSYRQPYSKVKINSQAVVQGSAFPLNMHLDVRKNRPDIKFHDIHYLEIIKSGEKAIARIYDFLHMPLSDKARENVLHWEQNNPIHKKGKHQYSLEEFNLTEEMVTESFAGYMELLDELHY
jgi:Sulfotransferase family